MAAPGIWALWSLTDVRLVDASGSGYDLDRFLAAHAARLPMPGGAILWHGYPRLGLDGRDQVDLLADGPGGLPALRRLCGDLRGRGILVYLAWLPWDRCAEGVRERFLDCAASLGIDGIFLDTLSGADDDFLARARAEGWGLMPESLPPVEAAAPYRFSWTEHRGDGIDVVHRHRLEESPCHVVMIRRWATDRFALLAEAWLNGASVLIWEDVFGSWNPWSARDAGMAMAMAAAWRDEHATIAHGRWHPAVDAGAPGVHASAWTHAGRRLWALANAGDAPATVRIPGARPLFGAEADGDRLRIPARSLAALVEGHGRAIAVPSLPEPPPWRAEPVPPPHPLRHGEGFAPLPADRTAVPAVWGRRECGDLVPFHHRAVFGGPPAGAVVRLTQPVPAEPAAIAPAPVTNRDYAAFIRATGYRPRDARNFLRHWRDGAPVAGTLDLPATWVDLDDARAYAAWRGWRLPTDAEWGLAVLSGAIRPAPCWEWTESERIEPAVRWCILVGGDPAHRVVPPDGSDGWFFPGGAGDGERRAKLLRGGPALDRAATVGFRCLALAGR